MTALMAFAALVALLVDGTGLLALAGTAAIAALLANLLNNLPATLLLLTALPTGAVPQLLAVLVGVNIGPNATYTGSLATPPMATRSPPRRPRASRTQLLPLRTRGHADSVSRCHRRVMAHSSRCLTNLAASIRCGCDQPVRVKSDNVRELLVTPAAHPAHDVTLGRFRRHTGGAETRLH
jgi:hypothetical protein